MQAILITAYKNLESLVDIFNYFDDDFNFYIHIDKKTPYDESLFSHLNNVKVFSTYNVNWGGINHLKAILHLCEEALKNLNNKYFHLITGEDFPILKLNEFKKLNFDLNYIEYAKAPSNWSRSEGLNRLTLFYFLDIINVKQPFNGKLYLAELHRRLINFQIKFKINRGIKRFYKFKFIYEGSTYWSLNRDSVSYVCNFNLENNIIELFKYTFCAEEYFFQTILLNASKDFRIINNDKRFIDWETRRGNSNPAFLDETDYYTIIESNDFFARKIKSTSVLRQKLKNE